MRSSLVLLLLALLHVLPTFSSGQQVADTTFRPAIGEPAYAPGTGPVVLIDESHSNFHTAEGRYRPFVDLLRRDGYVVWPSSTSITPLVLEAAAVFVTANARDPFAAAEVDALVDWVRSGGALLLIVDHPPFVEAAMELAKIFGVHLRNAGASDPRIPSGRLVFRRSDGTLRDHLITKGVDSVATFTGSFFEFNAAGEPLLSLGAGVYSYTDADSPGVRLEPGQLQGGVLAVGDGRIAVFAEAAMFSAQVTGPDGSPMGMNAPIANQNARFLLNLMHWLTQAQD